MLGIGALPRLIGVESALPSGEDDSEIHPTLRVVVPSLAFCI